MLWNKKKEEEERKEERRKTQAGRFLMEECTTVWEDIQMPCPEDVVEIG